MRSNSLERVVYSRKVKMPMETRTAGKKEGNPSAEDSSQLKYTETDIEFIKQEVANKEKRLQKEQEALELRQVEIDRKAKHLSEQLQQQEAELERRQREIESGKDASLSEDVQKKLARLAELEAKQIANLNIKTQRSNPPEDSAQDVQNPTKSTEGIVEDTLNPTQFAMSMVDDTHRDTNEAPGRSQMDEPRLGPKEGTELSKLLQKKAEIDREVKLLVARNLRDTEKSITETPELATDATVEESDPTYTRSRDESRIEAEILRFRRKLERKKGDLKKLAPHKSNPVDSLHTDSLGKGATDRNAPNQNVDNDHVSIRSVISIPTDDEELNLEAEALAREALIRRIQRENREKLKFLRGGTTGPDLGPQELGDTDVPKELILDKDLEMQVREQELWERELDLQEQELAFQAAQVDPLRERKKKLAEREEQLKKREQALKDRISGNNSPQPVNFSTAQSATIPTLPLAEQSISVKDALAVVPKFDGKNITVMQFNRACKRALEMVAPSLEGYLTRLIRSKLADRAYAVIEDESFTTLQGLLDKLTEVFAPVKSANHYRGELGQLYKYSDEHILDYIGRTRDIKTGLIEAERRKNRELTKTEIVKLDEEVCEAFIGGLPSDCRNAVLIKGYSTLKTAYEKAIDASKALEVDRDRARNRGVGRTEGNNPESCKHCGRTNHATEQCRSNRRPAINKPAEGREACTLCGRSTHSTANCFKNKQGSNQQSAGRSTSLAKCTFCDNLGHTYEECRKRKYSETFKNNSGNGAGPSGSGSNPRVARANALETEEVGADPSAST